MIKRSQPFFEYFYYLDLIIENLTKSKDNEEKSVSEEIMSMSEDIKKIGLDAKSSVKKEKS